jgi:hypothetical protein
VRMQTETMSDQERQADEAAIASLILRERHWRDCGEWDRMAEAYHPRSRVRLAFFDGTGPDFVTFSRTSTRQAMTKHRLSPSIVDVAGDRALAETSVVVETRTMQDGVEVDLFVYCRYLNRVRRDGGLWRLASVETVREKDTMRPVDPGAVLKLDPVRLAGYRSSYRFVSYNLDSRGVAPQPDLPGDDRPDLLRPLYAAAENWLRGSTPLEEL